MQLNKIKQVAIIGTGIMGSGVATEFARFGYDVNLYDNNAEAIKKALEQARRDLNIMVTAGLISGDEARASHSRLHPVKDFDNAAVHADYVLEASPEFLKLKQEIFNRLDKICSPRTIVASTTSFLSPNDLAAEMIHPERAMVTHYYSPPHFMPLVELVPGKKTSKEVTDMVTQIMKLLHKKAVIISPDRPIYAGNRLQSVLSLEAHALVDQGIPPTVVDDIIIYGFGRRMPYSAYFKRMDQVGLDGRTERDAARGIKTWPPVLEKVQNGEFGVKAGKGFYDWPGDSGQNFNDFINTELAKMMKHDIDEGII